MNYLTPHPVYADQLAHAAVREHLVPLLPRDTIAKIYEIITRDEMARIRAHNARSAFKPGWTCAPVDIALVDEREGAN